MNNDYLAHHGIKGQKWGIRRYQNSDGSLTDEGRRRYGYGRGAGGLMTQNTKERMLQGGKLGAKIGAGMGAVASAVMIPSMIGVGMTNPAGLAAVGAAYLANGTLSAGMYGLGIGAVVGAVETHKGRQYLERYDKGLDDFEMRDLRG